MVSRLLLLLSILMHGVLPRQHMTDPLALHDSLRELFPWRKGQVEFLEDPSHQLTLAQVRSGGSPVYQQPGTPRQFWLLGVDVLAPAPGA